MCWVELSFYKSNLNEDWCWDALPSLSTLSSTGPWTSVWPLWGWRCGVTQTSVPSLRTPSPRCTSSWTGGSWSCFPWDHMTTPSWSGGTETDTLPLLTACEVLSAKWGCGRVGRGGCLTELSNMLIPNCPRMVSRACTHHYASIDWL